MLLLSQVKVNISHISLFIDIVLEHELIYIYFFSCISFFLSLECHLLLHDVLLSILQLNFYLTWLKQSLIKIQEVQVDAIDIQLMLYLNDTDVLHEVHYKYAQHASYLV